MDSTLYEICPSKVGQYHNHEGEYIIFKLASLGIVWHQNFN